MSYVFSNLSDEKLSELGTAVRKEQERRFLATSNYPKLSLSVHGGGNYAVEGIKAYRAAYDLSLTHAHMLFNHYHR